MTLSNQRGFERTLIEDPCIFDEKAGCVCCFLIVAVMKLEANFKYVVKCMLVMMMEVESLLAALKIPSPENNKFPSFNP